MKSVRLVLILMLCALPSACASSSAGAPFATAVPPRPAVLDELPRGENKLPLINVYLTDASAVAEMDIETYVCGVLAGEMPSDWPLEALKAQAVLARTFVLKFVSEKSSRYGGADISTDITEAQAYDADAVNETIRQAVNETRGQVLLTSSGELPYAWFHAHSGGTTALAERLSAGTSRSPPTRRSWTVLTARTHLPKLSLGKQTSLSPIFSVPVEPQGFPAKPHAPSRSANKAPAVVP